MKLDLMNNVGFNVRCFERIRKMLSNDELYNRITQFNNLTIMGILNTTPDSFSDGNKYIKVDDALRKAEQMISEGVDIIDVGGESSRPYSKEVAVNEELDRVVPVIEAIKRHFDISLSVDTRKSQVAEEALKNGVQVINDISGFKFDDKMITVAKRYNAVSVIMHMKGTPEEMQTNPTYKSVVEEVYEDLKKSVLKLRLSGLDKIIVDPGFGFGKTLDHNYQLLKQLSYFKNLGVPILAGISRKSMVGNITETEPDNRLGGTIALNTVAVINGANILRVHDVEAHRQLKVVIEKFIQTGN